MPPPQDVPRPPPNPPNNNGGGAAGDDGGLGDGGEGPFGMPPGLFETIGRIAQDAIANDGGGGVAGGIGNVNAGVHVVNIGPGGGGAGAFNFMNENFGAGGGVEVPPPNANNDNPDGPRVGINVMNRVFVNGQEVNANGNAPNNPAGGDNDGNNGVGPPPPPPPARPQGAGGDAERPDVQAVNGGVFIVDQDGNFHGGGNIQGGPIPGGFAAAGAGGIPGAFVAGGPGGIPGGGFNPNGGQGEPFPGFQNVMAGIFGPGGVLQNAFPPPQGFPGGQGNDGNANNNAGDGH